LFSSQHLDEDTIPRYNRLVPTRSHAEKLAVAVFGESEVR